MTLPTDHINWLHRRFSGEEKMRVVNLTPHHIKVVHPHDPNVVKEYAPSGVVCRVKLSSEKVDTIDDMPVYETQHEAVDNLPEPEDGVVYLVSRLVVECLQGERMDVISPGDAIRDRSGRIVGCRGFSA